MEKIIVESPEIKLVGIGVRTNNTNESDQSTSKIAPAMQSFVMDKISDKIKNKKHYGKLFSIYKDYSLTNGGEYTYFIGEEVENFDDVAEGLETATIPPQKYAKFISPTGPMPDIVVDAWKSIWSMSEEDLGGKRSFIADFEIYDAHKINPHSASVEVYVGIL